MKKLHNCLTAALAALTTVALAQPPAAPNAPAAPPPPAQAQAAPPMGNMRQAITPASFVQMAAVGGLFEVQSSELATTAGQSAEVKAFAQQMITDHTKANQELQQLAASKNLQVPATLDQKHAATLKELAGKSGEEFDKAYGQAQLRAHRMAVRLFEQGSAGLQDPELKAFATKTLPTLQQHLQKAQSLPGADSMKGDNGKKGKKGMKGEKKNGTDNGSSSNE